MRIRLSSHFGVISEWLLAADELKTCQEKSLDAVVVTRMGHYIECEWQALVEQHRKYNEAISRAFDSEGPLDLWVVDPSRFSADGNLLLTLRVTKAAECVIEGYVNRLTGGRDFRRLAKELALQVAGFGARWVSREEVPDEVLVKEREVYEAKALQDGKPEQVIPRIVEGQVEDFLKHNCLLEQEYFREPGRTVQQLIAENISKLQENITVRRFARFNIREN